MKKHILFLILALVLISVIVITGCGHSTTSTTTPATTAKTSTAKTTTPTAQPIYGGTLRVIVSSTSRNLGDPGATGLTKRSLMTEPLTLLDTQGNLVPWLLTSWVLDPDAKTMTFKVRQGVRFHDGTDFNAEAVKWNWEQYISFGGIPGSVDLKSIDVLDPYTVRLSFNKYSALYIFAFTNTIVMLSPTAVQTNGKDWAKTHCVGTGPFKLADFKADSYQNMVRNDDYWGTKPYLDGINYTVISDATVAAMTMRTKAADMWDPSDLQQSAALRDEGGYQVIYRRALLTFMAGDGANPNSVYANQNVREALEYALDRDGIAKARGFGMYAAINQFASPGDKPYNPDIAGRKYDVAKAKQMLAAAGYPDGFKTKLICQTTSQDTCVLVQSYLAAVGIQVTIDAADTARWQSITGAGGTGWTDSLIWGGTGINGGDDYIRWTICNTFSPQPKAIMTSILKSPAYIDLWNQANYVRTMPEAEAIGTKLVKQMYDDAMIVPVYTSPYVIVCQKWVHTNFLTVHHQMWNPELDWMDKH